MAAGAGAAAGAAAAVAAATVAVADQSTSALWILAVPGHGEQRRTTSTIATTMPVCISSRRCRPTPVSVLHRTVEWKMTKRKQMIRRLQKSEGIDQWSIRRLEVRHERR